ncbi:uncharacterized protein e(y)3 isoform X2 [Halyomorpha halys]|uniref:uncharacterized protein e(y)3 isoform X2 n=1 Tax=Halyomorpha halys TaxID=286706 RepID=UPI0006D4C880|nr:uncharacterized protein LOC106686724 isoform X2 [Halyomorpha halys]
MDDPNLMQNTTSISPDKKDNMTSVSPPKRTIVLGVVNTTGMKSTNINRKRRWDQAPEDISGPPTVKKLCISENEALPVKEIESLEAASAVSPNFDRINSQCDNISGLSNQSTHATLVENEEISIEITRSLSSDISSEASAMSIDLPDDKSDKCKPPLCEPSSDIKSCSDSNVNLSEVNILESCDRLQSVETVDSPTNDSRFVVSDVTLNKETSSVAVSETKVVKHELKSNVSATVISHQSEELRRIMFSYDEGSSDSDAMETSKADIADEEISSGKVDEDVTIVRPSNISPSGSKKEITGVENSDTACERVSFNDTVMSGNDISYVSPISIVKKPISIQPEYDSNETDAFIESSNSLENLGENKGSLIESQLNIPNKSEVVEITIDREIKCDSLENKNQSNPNQENVEVNAENFSSIHNADSIENSPPKVTQNLRHLDDDNQNQTEGSVIKKSELINVPLGEEVKNDPHMERVTEIVSADNNIKDKIKIDEEWEADSGSKELSSNYDRIKEEKANSSDDDQQKNLMNEVSLKFNSQEPVEGTSEHDNEQLELDNPSKYKLQSESETIQVEKVDKISDDKREIICSIERHVSPSADLLVNDNSPETNALQVSGTSSPDSIETDNCVMSEEISSEVLVAPLEPATVALSSENTKQNHKLIHCEELQKVDAGTIEDETLSSANETITHDEPSKYPCPEETPQKKENRTEDSQRDITDCKTSNEKSSLLRLQSCTEEVYLNDDNVIISNMSEETNQSSDKCSVSVINKQNLNVTESLNEDVNISMDVTQSDNIDPAIMEVILGSNEETAVVKEVVNECSVISGTSESDRQNNVSVLVHPEIIATNINLEEKMDIVNETDNSPSEPEKSVCDNVLECSANIIESDEGDKNIETASGNDINDVREVINTDDCTPVENAVENNKTLNVIENDIGTNHIKIGESYKMECETIEKSEPEQPSDSSITKMEIITSVSQKIEEEISGFENTETANTVEDTEKHLKLIERNELGLNTDKIIEAECHKADAIEPNNTEISSVDGEQTEIRSIENNDIEISTEETIETEISIEENVESELFPLESDEIVTVESNINLLNSEENVDLGSSPVENVMTIENCDNETHVIEKDRSSAVGTNENVNSKSEEVLSETENKSEIESSVRDISPSRTIEQELQVLEDVSGSSEIKNVSDSTRDILKELVIQEEITMDGDSAIECVYDNDNLAVREDDIVLSSVDSPSYEGALNPSPEESKIFEKSIDVSETIDDEMGIDSNVIIEPEESKTIDEEIDSSKVVPSVEISPELSYVEESILQDDSKTLTEDIESFVVEEVVTCESSESNKDGDNEFVSVNEDMSSPLIVFEETCETTDTFVNTEVNAVIKENTVDSEVSVIDNQNEISNDSNLDFKKYDKSKVEKTVQKNISISKDLIIEPSVNSIRPDSPLLDMECESSVNSITKTDSDVEMDIGEPPSSEKSSIGLKLDSMKVETPPPSVLNIGSDLSSVTKDIGINVPLLTTVNNTTVLIKDKPASTSVVDINRSGSIPGIDPKLEPITLRIYKDNLSVRTDDLDSPKKSRSPKLSSELKSQLSPHIKSSDSRSSLSPTTKKLEFTLKIAKDVNTNIPRATMSPKNSVSPSGIHKPGDILRAELTAESGRNSPAYMNPSESGPNKVKLIIQKPGLSKDYISHIESNIKEESNMKDDIVDHSSGIRLPKPPIEIGNVFKKMMETEKNVDSKPDIGVVDHSPLLATPLPVVRKRGRPRKILQKVLTGADPNLSSNMTPGQTPGLPFNHTPGLDVSDSSDQSSRQVRSCRARTKPIVVKTRKPRGGGARGGMRGRGAISSGVGGIVRNLAAEIEQDKLAGKLSEREKAELAKIEERKERQRQERHAKNEAKKAKKLARKLKDEERRLKKLREKAEKAEAAAPQVFEEETRMSAPDGGSRGHTPAPASALSRLNQTSEHNEESQNSISTPTSSQIKRGRMEIPIDPECKEVRVEHLAEYQWQGSELFMVQEQVSLYLGVKSFKRKYPDLKRRSVEAEERTFLEDSGLVPKSMCDLGLTAVSSAEILDIMYQDFPEKYEEFRKYVREKQAREASFKQKVFASLKQDKSKGEPREQALEAVAMWNSNLNRERREERRCALDLQTFTVHYPKQMRDRMSRPVPKAGLYPVSLIPGQFSDAFKVYTPTELMYFPLNTVMYGPLKPNERQPINPSDGSGSDSSSSSTSDDSSSSSSECESEDENGVTRECKICNGEKKTIRESHPEILLQCSNCKGLCHPTCQEITPEMLPHIKKYTWHCSNCKKCMTCKNTTKDDKMLFCDLCDRGYHIHCVGLRKAPEGRWHCSVCSFCTACGSKDPGGPEWNYEYKKTDKGVRLYQRTLCVPCSKNALM